MESLRGHHLDNFERTRQPSAEGRDDTDAVGEGDTLVEQTDPDLTDAWRAVLDNIQPNQRAWLSACDPVTVHDELAIIAVPDEFTRTQVEGRLRAELEGALSEVFGRKIGLGTTINPALVAGSPEHEQRQAHADAARPAGRRARRQARRPPGGARQRRRFID